jgi:hypothetical protein
MAPLERFSLAAAFMISIYHQNRSCPKLKAATATAVSGIPRPDISSITC